MTNFSGKTTQKELSTWHEKARLSLNQKKQTRLAMSKFFSFTFQLARRLVQRMMQHMNACMKLLKWSKNQPKKQSQKKRMKLRPMTRLRKVKSRKDD